MTGVACLLVHEESESVYAYMAILSTDLVLYFVRSRRLGSQITGWNTSVHVSYE